MLPEFIIEELKRREQKKELFEEIRIECPLDKGPENARSHDSSEDGSIPDRGVTIIDFTI